MSRYNRTAIAALTTAGVLWGFTVPLSKLGLTWLAPAWLASVRFGVAAVGLGFVARHSLRAALTPRILCAGAIGFGGVLMLQNAGIERTSVTHAALLVGVVPVLVALLALGTKQPTTRPLTWGGYALALGGVILVAGNRGAGATTHGDLLVLGSAILSAGFIAVQPRLLAGRGAAAVTAVQFGAGALAALAVAVPTEGKPVPTLAPGPLAVLALLSLAGTLLPFWLFAYGQARLPSPVAGAFVNLEPLVGAAAGWLAFGDPIQTAQVLGGLAVLTGIVLSAAPPRLRGRSLGRPDGEIRPSLHCSGNCLRPRRDGPPPASHSEVCEYRRRAFVPRTKQGAERGCYRCQGAAGGWCPFRSPDPALESKDAPLHLWRAGRHLHHRPAEDRGPAGAGPAILR